MNPNWTPPAHGLDDLRKRFGAIQVRDGQVVAPAHWESLNMVRLPSLPGWPRGIYCNKAIKEPLTEALRRCVALGDGYQIKSLGCFAPRAKRTSDRLSVHSWGLAIDINPATNPLAPYAGAPCVCDIPMAWVAIFEELGWTWGGKFTRPDPMHFQFCSGY